MRQKDYCRTGCSVGIVKCACVQNSFFFFCVVNPKKNYCFTVATNTKVGVHTKQKNPQ